MHVAQRIARARYVARHELMAGGLNAGGIVILDVLLSIFTGILFAPTIPDAGAA